MNLLDWLSLSPIIFGSVASIKPLSLILLHHSTPLHSLTLECTLNNFYCSAPLLPNILPHLQTLVNFITNTLPKPVLVALLYRLTILHLASRILPTIGADSWESEDGVDDGWDGRPVNAFVSAFDHFILTAMHNIDINLDAYPVYLQAVYFGHGIFTSLMWVVSPYL